MITGTSHQSRSEARVLVALPYALEPRELEAPGLLHAMRALSQLS